MTKWIKLQSSVGSRAAERMRQEEGGGEVQVIGRKTKERETGRQVVLVESTKIFDLDRFLSLLFF